MRNVGCISIQQIFRLPINQKPAQQKGGNTVTAAERRQEIMNILVNRRCATKEELALAGIGMIWLYEAEGEPYFCFPK